MNKLARLTPEDRENLTAYLDGELDESDTRRIESILASSSAARSEVESLIRTYDFLEALPRPTASSEFAGKTLATARQETVRKPLAQQPWFQRSQQGAALAGSLAAVFAAAACGFALTNQWIPQPEDALLRELPVIENLDLYSEVGNLEFLRQLQSDAKLLEEIRGKDRE